MKRITKMTGILLVLILAGNGALLGQRGMRGMMMDSTRMNRMRMGVRPDSSMMIGPRQGRGPGNGPGMYQYMDRQHVYGMRRGMGPGTMYGLSPDRFRYPGFGMGKGMRPGYGMGMLRPAPGTWLIDNVPNLTEKQKKDITDLRQKQREEMHKFREENAAKIKSMQESHRSKIMNLLTPEQKKWVDERMGNPASAK
jgi:Spy/CpxP family protein refolding chaperone